jgi:SAM-dependent methyltransferase
MQERLWQELRAIEEWHWWLVARRRIFVDFLRHAAAGYPLPPSILDCGCGTGRLLQCLHEFARPVGIDMEQSAIDTCWKRSQEVLQGKVEELPFPDASFDIVCAFDVLEHLDDPAAALSRMRTVLKPRGQLFLSVPAYRWLWDVQDDMAGHRRRYRSGEVKRSLVEAGFRVLKLTYFNTLLFPAAAAVRVFRKVQARWGRSEPRSDFSLSRPGLVNDILEHVFVSELHWIKKKSFPFGGSVFAIAQRC